MMMLGRAALDLCMAAVVLSLISIVLFCVLGAGASLLTAARARRGVHRRSGQLERLSHGCSVAELAAIDDALEQVLAQERGVMPRSHGG